MPSFDVGFWLRASANVRARLVLNAASGAGKKLVTLPIEMVAGPGTTGWIGIGWEAGLVETVSRFPMSFEGVVSTMEFERGAPV